MKFEWEEIDNNSGRPGLDYWEATYRARIFGGWLIRHELFYDYQYFDHEHPTKRIGEEWMKRESSMVFIPDLEHLWEIEKD